LAVGEILGAFPLRIIAEKGTVVAHANIDITTSPSFAAFRRFSVKQCRFAL
jgi:hypothetical protein